MLLAVRSPDTLPSATQPVTKTSQRAMARHGWVALQRATRTVIGRRKATGFGDTALPLSACGLLPPATLPLARSADTGPGSPAMVDFSPPRGRLGCVRMDRC